MKGQNMNNLATPYVFDKQIKAWGELEKLVNQNTLSGKTFNRAILLAQPQVGKTSFMVWGAIQRVKRAEELGRGSFNIIAISDANNALRDQTHKDLEHAIKCAGLTGDKHTFIEDHRTNLQYVKLPTDVMLTVITDDSHIAARTGGSSAHFSRRVYHY